MLSHILKRNAPTLLTRSVAVASIRPLSTTAVRHAEQGAIRYGAGQPSEDSFKQRQMASENMYIYEREAAFRKELKKRIDKQREILEADEKMLREIEEAYGEAVL